MSHHIGSTVCRRQGGVGRIDCWPRLAAQLMQHCSPLENIGQGERMPALIGGRDRLPNHVQRLVGVAEMPENAPKHGAVDMEVHPGSEGCGVAPIRIVERDRPLEMSACLPILTEPELSAQLVRALDRC